MKNIRTIVCLLTVLTITIIGCKKDDDSAYQPKGSYGNANITSLTVSISSWAWDPSQYFDYSDTSLSEITPDVYDNGLVNVYSRTAIGWAQWPRTMVLGGGITVNQRFYYQVGTIKFVMANSDQTSSSLAYPTTFKVVIITPAAKLANPHVDWSNYSEVQETFKLID